MAETPPKKRLGIQCIFIGNEKGPRKVDFFCASAYVWYI
jgi:hypothetical protein